MSFRISTVKDNGSRESSTLIENEKALISASSDSDLICSLPEGVSITVSETAAGITLQPSGTSLLLNGSEKDGEVNIRGGSDFEACGIHFCITKQIGIESTPRKKTFLSAFGLGMVWILLGVMVAAPFVLDAKIKTHESKGVYALFDKCSNYLDELREIMKGEMSRLSEYTQAHQDIIRALNEEIEQMAWAFRTGGSFMNEEKLAKLEKDIQRYRRAVKRLRKSDSVKVTPLDSGDVLEAIIPDR